MCIKRDTAVDNIMIKSSKYYYVSIGWVDLTQFSPIFLTMNNGWAVFSLSAEKAHKSLQRSEGIGCEFVATAFLGPK